MERLLVIKLEAQGCEAEAILNGVPLARANAARERVILPVHEFTLAGNNRLELVIWPRPAVVPEKPALPPEPRTSDGKLSAHVRILLPRMGQQIEESTSRTLGQLDWQPQTGLAYEAPLSLSQDVSLPVSFPRWRWLDAPPAEPSAALMQQVVEFIQGIATDLTAGVTDSFLAATRWRTEELAVAYQRRAEDETERIRRHLLSLHAAGRLIFQPLDASKFALRRIAGGRLLECLDACGAHALQTVPDELGQTVMLALRIAVLEKKIYVLR